MIFLGRQTKKGEKIANYIISLNADKHFVEILSGVSEIMSCRLVIDHLLVCASASDVFLSLSKSSNHLDSIMKSVYKGIDAYLYGFREDGIEFIVKDIIVNDSEKRIFLDAGWNFTEKTDPYTIIDVIANYRVSKYAKAIHEGLFESINDNDGTRLTAKLMQECKINCGQQSFPYIEMKLIYSSHISMLGKFISK